MTRLTAFSWGYYGWGNHVGKLIQTVDSIEKQRGWQAPIFADIRIRRSVRAKGFNGDRFERALGEDRYVWLPGLGNRSIITGHDRTKIDDPNAVLHLLAVVAAAQRKNQRVIFFCSCENPWECHRHNVGTLLLNAARRQRLDLTVTEWPGGKSTKEPEQGHLELTKSAWKTIRKEGMAVPLAELSPSRARRLASLAWGSRVRVSCGDEKMWLVSGPAQFRRGRWELPILEWHKSTISAAQLKSRADAEVRRLCFAPRSTSSRSSN